MKRNNIALILIGLFIASCSHENPSITPDIPVDETKIIDSEFLYGKWKITLKKIVDVYRDSKGYHREFILSQETFKDQKSIIEFSKDSRIFMNNEIIGRWSLRDEHYIYLKAEGKNINQPLLLNSDFFYNKKRTYMNLVCKVNNSLGHEYRFTYTLVHESRW